MNMGLERMVERVWKVVEERFMHMAERFVFISHYLHPTTRRRSLNQTPPSCQPLPIPEGRPGISNLVVTVTEHKSIVSAVLGASHSKDRSHVR